jgi:hypothetical protein
MTRPDLEQPLEQIARLVDELEQHPDAATRERARTLVQAILDVHRVALRRLLELVAARGGEKIVGDLAHDDAVALLLALHGLHPEDIAKRVGAAVDELRARLNDDGVAIELGAVSEERAVILLRAVGEVHTPGAALRAVIETAIARNAPEISTIEIVGLEASDVPLERLRRK